VIDLATRSVAEDATTVMYRSMGKRLGRCLTDRTR
jgi:hypothetical protein